MRSLTELKLNNVKPPPTSDDIGRFESRFRLSLPSSYKEFLLEGNGAHPELDTFRESTGQEWAVNNFFHLGPNEDDTENLVWNCLNRWPEITSEFVPIARDGFDNLFLIRCTTEKEDSIWICVHDDPDQPLRELTSCFEDFIDRLQVNPDYI